MITPIVFIVDDEEAVRTALSRLLRSAGIKALAYSSAEEFLADHDPQHPGCLLLDIGLPGFSGMELQREWIRRNNLMPIIFLTGQGDISTGVKAMKEGAVDFLTKPVNDEELISAIRAAFEKDRVARESREKIEKIQVNLAHLTPREREVLEYVISGSLNKQIAAVLGTSERTIKAHRASIMDKMKIDSLAELVRLSEAAGIRFKSAMS